MKTTTLRKLISEIDKTKPHYPNFERLAELFNIYELYYSDNERLKCFFIKKWYCTDSYVGVRAYFLDDEFVAISNQYGRKMSEEFSFISKDSINKVKKYLESLVEETDQTDLDLIEDDELDEEITSTYKIEYNSQILHKEAFLNNEKVQIIKNHYNFDERDKYFHTVKIKLSNGKTKEVDCRELDFEYNI